jgi:RNA polymerase sigma factor (sigma-70 family)
MSHPPDDGTLLESFRDTRSESAFTELVRRHLPLVFHVAQRRLGSAALAQEATQNAFTRLAAKSAAVARNPERLRAWLHRTAYFEASTLARKESRLSRIPVIPDPEPMNRPEIYDRLDEALNKLPDLDRELVLRHCCGGEDYRQMASVTGKSEAACQKRVERALARLADGMGGARTTATVVAAFAASSVELPAAETIAAAALKQHAATGAVAGAISGAKVAAWAALALAGGAAGWKQDSGPPPPPVIVHSAAAPSAIPQEKSGGAAPEIALAPRPVRIERTLDEVLETILAGRLAPLVEFLPQATAADLRAIMAEDDIGDLSEGMGTFGTAHDLAARRWVEIEPAAAFRYGLSRSESLATRMLARWMETDPQAAEEAFLALPSIDRNSLAADMVQTHDEVADRLAVIDPASAWVIREQRLAHPDPEQAERRVAGILEGRNPDQPEGAEADKARNAFAELARHDPETTLARARLIPWPEIRALVLADLGHPPGSATLPPGVIRTTAVERETEELMKTDPEAAILRWQTAALGAERDAMHEVVSGQLAGSDPWRFLELSASMKGSLPTSDAVGRSLSFASKSDPQRVLALLPEIAARYHGYNGARGFAEDILAGWVQTDAVGAIRWAGEAGIWLNSDDLANATTTPETALELFSDPNRSVQAMAKGALRQHVETGLADGSAEELLEKIPPDAADDLIQWIAADAIGRGSYDEAMAIAVLASAEARTQEILPQMGFRALREDPVAGIEWLRSLSKEDQRTVVDGVERTVSDPEYGGGDALEIREALELLTP